MTVAIQHKRYTSELKTVDGERAVIARISTETADRENEVLIAGGCDTTDFLKSPTVFYNHDYALPVGVATDVVVGDGYVEAKTIFAAKPDDHDGPWLPSTLLSLFRQGVIRGFSVGFVPVTGRRATEDDRGRYGKSAGYIHEKWRMVEYSVAPMPANPDALATAVSKGIITPTEAAQLVVPKMKRLLAARKILRSLRVGL
jgi:phage head maturation protease